MRFHGVASERARLKESFRSGSFDICITTYEIFSAEESWFKTRRWFYCVLDEGHKIKNAEANVTQKIQGIGSLFRLGRFKLSRARKRY
jgi:SWI/SNF-related matrix-associated actin-dependent regulator of chromatin subfamily A member 5